MDANLITNLSTKFNKKNKTIDAGDEMLSELSGNPALKNARFQEQRPKRIHKTPIIVNILRLSI